MFGRAASEQHELVPPFGQRDEQRQKNGADEEPVADDDVDHHRAGFHHLRQDEVGLACRHDEDVGEKLRDAALLGLLLEHALEVAQALGVPVPELALHHAPDGGLLQ